MIEGLSGREALAVRLAEAITETPGEVSEDFYNELREEFSPEELAELSSAFAWKNYLARFNRVYDIPSDEYPS
jgi:alkylhydroperoxidase family enzyme